MEQSTDMLLDAHLCLDPGAYQGPVITMARNVF